MQKNRKRSRRNRRVKQQTGSIFAVVFCIVIVLLMAVNILTPDKEMSPDEDRRLAGRPEFYWDSLVSGDYMEKYEVYLKDQFAGRDLLRNLRLTLNRLGGSREENGVLLGKGGQLMETIAIPEQESLTANLEAIEKFIKSHKNMTDRKSVV